MTRSEATGTGKVEAVRASIRRHGEILRHPEGYPERLVLRSLAYVYAAYALGSRTASAELDAHLGRYRGSRRPSPDVAMGMARGFQRMADGAA
ncbi:MAG: hypothetical protein HY905_01885 [Deltaproteobacteria bacterium]|nr:hypothetical protein [Deltaproteobacteria bacterium]